MENDFTCRCGKSYPTLKELQDHWKDPNRGPGAHYRQTPDSGHELSDLPSDSRMRKDGK